MNQSQIAVRYAKALFQLSVEKNIIEQIRGDMLTIQKAAKEISEFSILLNSPVISNSDKQKALGQIFKGKIHDHSLSFLLLVTGKNRESYIPDMTRNYLDLVKAHKGIKTASLTTAVKITEQLREQLIEVISREFKAIIEMEETVDENIIGGFILRVDDRQFDTSISSRLGEWKRALLQTSLKN